MAIPSTAEAELLLASFDLPDGIVAHSRGVSRVAAEAAGLLAAAGVGSIRTSSRSPPSCTTLTSRRPARRRRSRAGWRAMDGRAWTTGTRRADRLPSIGCLLDPERTPRGWDAIAVAVADRHVAQAFVTIDERIDDQARRYPAFRGEPPGCPRAGARHGGRPGGGRRIDRRRARGAPAGAWTEGAAG